MKKFIYFLVLTLLFSTMGIMAISCKHQKCPAYMTKEEIDAAHKASAKKFKKKAKKKDLF